MKKLLTGILVAVIIVTSVYTPQTVYGTEMDITEYQQDSTAAMNNEMSVEGTSSFGTLFANMAKEKQKEQEENQGFNVFSAEVADNQATVSFETLKDCTLVVAIYDEAGKKMLTSGSTEVKKGDTSVSVSLDQTAMPEYFYLRCFLVEDDTLRPLCTEYASPNYTKEMQEFFAKTTDDFDSEKVLNLDGDKTDNFAVYGDDIKIIPRKDGVNEISVLGDDIYVFKQTDEIMMSLEEGDIFVYEYDTNENMIVKVGEIKKDGKTVTVTGADTSMEEVFQYVKIEGKSSIDDAKVDASSCEEGVQYNGIVHGMEPEASNAYKLSFTFVDKELKTVEDQQGEEKVSVKLNGGVELAVENTAKLYLSFSYIYFELSMEYSLTGNIAISGEISAVDIPLAIIGFSPVAGVYVDFTPSIVFEASAEAELSISVGGTVGFSVSTDEGIKNLTSLPEVESELKGEVKIFIGISLKPRVMVISDRIAEMSFEATVGGEATATLSEELELPFGESDDQPDEIHDCKHCIDGDIVGKWEMSVEAQLLNSDKLTFTYERGCSTKIGDFYYSIDRREFAFTSCPHIFWKVDFKVKDDSGDSVEGIKLTASSGQFLVSEDGEDTEYADELITDGKGKATGYLQNGTHHISADNGEYYGSKKITVTDNAKRIGIKVKRGLPEIQICNGTVAVIAEDGSLYMWGNNNYGQVGDGTLENRTTPVKILENVASISMEKNDGLIIGAITKAGELYMWGGNECGQVGDGTTAVRTSPIKVLENVATVSIDWGTTSAITEAGELYMWGANGYGQVGDGTTENKTKPVKVKVLENVAKVSIDWCTTSAITEAGELYMWGKNGYGQVGDGTTENRTTPVKVLENVTTVNGDGSTIGAITEAGELYMWGKNDEGELGDGTTEDRTKPFKVLENVATVSIDYDIVGGARNAITQAIKKTGELYVWGWNGYGQVGDGTTNDRTKPIKVLENVTTVSSDAYTTGAITEAGELYMWGYNYYGEVGDGTTTHKTEPVKIQALKNVATVGIVPCSHNNSIIAITKAGELYMWGENRYGEVGDGTLKPKTTPIKVLENVATVSCNGYTTGAITKSGKLYMWGDNGCGQIGDGTTKIALTPKQISLPYDSKPVVSKETEQKVEAVSVNSVAGMETENQMAETASLQNIVTTGENGDASGLIPNTLYNYYVMKSKSGEQPFTTNNLLYIGQALSDASGNLHIDYEMKEEYTSPKNIVVGMAQLELSNEDVTVSDVIYNGEEQDIYPVVTYHGAELEEGKDYEVSCDFTAKKVGEYTIIIKGIGYYTGSVSKTYKVYAAGETPTSMPTQEPVTPEPTKTLNVTPTLEPTQTVTSTPTPKTENKTLQKTYGNKAFSVAVKKDNPLKYKSSKTSVATVNQKGSVNIKGCGKTDITITDAVTGHVYQKITLTVVPKKPALSAVKTSTKKVLKIKWSKVEKADGYEIYYATNKTFSNKKTILVKSNKTVKKTVKKLKSGKKYYVKMRAYKNWDGTKINGSWSKTVSIKVK